MDRIKECQEYIKRWYLGQQVQTVQMHGSDNTTEQCIQSMVVELLRDFIDNPFPENLKEGTMEFNTYIDQAFRKAMAGMEFGFSMTEEDAVKNLAWNYFAEGIKKTQSNPQLKDRLITCSKHWPENRKVQ